jgi:hypothetical protein
MWNFFIKALTNIMADKETVLPLYYIRREVPLNEIIITQV